MPQGPITAAVALNSQNQAAEMRLDPQNALRTSTGGISSTFNITAATVVKASPGRLVKISVIVAGSAAGTANDCATTGAAAVGNQIAAIPNSVGVISTDWPCSAGIVIVPGTGQTLAVSFS